METGLGPVGVFGGEEEEGGVRSGSGEVRTIVVRLWRAIFALEHFSAFPKKVPVRSGSGEVRTIV
jgi:hypothetical protein